jgi:hypothetical protein
MTVIKYCLLDISKVIYIMYLKFLVRLDDNKESKDVKPLLVYYGIFGQNCDSFVFI